MSPIAAAYESQAAASLAPPMTVEDAVQTHSHQPMQCATALDEQRIRDALDEADAVLDADAWTWMRELTHAMHDEKIKIQTKLFFLRLLRAADVEDTALVLEEMEAWREQVQGMKTGKKSLNKEEREGIQALFLLGLDKQMSLRQCP